MDYRMLLNELLAALNLNKKKFAEGMGLSQGNVSDWFNRPGYRPSIDALRRIRETYDVNLNWLVTGDGEMFNNDSRARGTTAKLDPLRLPVVADIAAGHGIEAEDVELVEWLTIHRSLLPVPGPYYAFRVSGESMMPYIMEGDYAVVSRSWHELDLNGQILAVRTIDGLTLKRFMFDRKKKIMALIPLNPKYPIMLFDEMSPDYTIVGLLVLMVRKYSGGE